MKTKSNDFVDLKFTGYSNGQVFDSNIEEDLKKINPEAKPQKTIVAIGHGMVPRGLDSELKDKEVGKEYEVLVPMKDAFGPRKRELIRIIPLSSFAAQNVNPAPGMVFMLDNHMVKVLAVSGARVTVDFNNPLAGKDLNYKFTIEKIVTDEKEKTETLFSFFFRHIPEYEIKDKKIIVRGPKNFELFINVYKEKFKELIGKELEFSEKTEKPDKKEDKNAEKPAAN